MSDPGMEKAHAAAEPDWFAQVDAQMTDVFVTLLEINDPTCDEAFLSLESAIQDAKKMKTK